MPKKLEDCVSDLKNEGKSESEAYAICAKSTGWVRKKGGGWMNKKTGEVFNESTPVMKRLNIDGKTYKDQDFLDLVLAMKDKKNHRIKVIYKVGNSLSRDYYDEYIRDNQGRWTQSVDGGRPVNFYVDPVLKNGQPMIKITGNTRDKKIVQESFYDLFVESNGNDPFDVKKGNLHKWCGIPEDEEITCECIRKAMKAGGHPKKMAQWAINFSDIDCGYKD